MDVESMRVVRGAVVLPVDVPAGETAELVVQVEDVSRADAPSVVIGEQRQPEVQVTPGAAIPFEVQVPTGLLDASHSYAVRAHVDISGSGSVQVGDLLSTQSYPVLTHGYGDEATIEVKVI